MAACAKPCEKCLLALDDRAKLCESAADFCSRYGLFAVLAEVVELVDTLS